MSVANIILLARLGKRTSNVILNHVQRRQMPVNVPPTATGKRKFRLAVETDPHKLVNYCCGLNYHIDEPPIELKPDNEYPDWLWSLRLGPELNSWEMQEGTKEYYLRLAKEGRERNYLLRMRGRGVTKTVGKTLKENEEYLHRLRFAALAHMEDDAGLELESMETDWWWPLAVQARDYYLPVKENKTLYKDKIEGNTHQKNFYSDPDSTFKGKPRDVRPRGPIVREAIQDSKRRHRYAGT